MLAPWNRKHLFARASARKKESGPYRFTLHAEYKMREYHLSRQRVVRVIRNPKRTEEGIVENTVAVMQPSSTKRVGAKETWSQEIWVMYVISLKMKNQKGKLESLLKKPELKIISAWRYPGVSPKRNPIPEDILREIEGSISMETGA
jgi:hypothetical protein